MFTESITHRPERPILQRGSLCPPYAQRRMQRVRFPFPGSAVSYLEEDCDNADDYYVYKMARTQMDDYTAINRTFYRK